MKLKELTVEQFDQFVNSYPVKSIFETSSYGLTMNSHGNTAYYLGLMDGSKIMGATLLLVKKERGFKYATAPRGPLIDFNNKELLKEFTVLLKDYLKKNSIIAVKINPIIIRNIYDVRNGKVLANPEYDKTFANITSCGYYHLGYNNYFEALKPRFEAIINMSDDLPTIFGNFAKETRTKIRSAQNKGVEIFRGGQEDISELYKLIEKKYPRDINYFYDLFNFFDDTKEVDVYYAKLNISKFLTYTQNEYSKYMLNSQRIDNLVIKKGDRASQSLIDKKIDADRKFEKAQRNIALATSLANKHPDGLLIASMFIIRNNGTIYSIMEGTNPKFKSFNGKQLMTWAIVDKFKNQGYTSFNLGGCTNPNIKNNKFAGLNEFKTNFGAYIYEYAGDFELIANKPLYFMYQNAIDDKKTR